jgi:hypothetical protein
MRPGLVGTVRPPAFDDPDTPIVLETQLELGGLTGRCPDRRGERMRMGWSQRTRGRRDEGADFKLTLETTLAFYPPEARRAPGLGPCHSARSPPRRQRLGRRA